MNCHGFDLFACIYIYNMYFCKNICSNVYDHTFSQSKLDYKLSNY